MRSGSLRPFSVSESTQSAARMVPSDAIVNMKRSKARWMVGDIGNPVYGSIRSTEVDTNLLDGICAEAVSLLKDKQCPMAAFEILRKMRPLRQIEAAELLVNANNYSVSYASAILAGTPQAQLMDGDRAKKVKGVTPEAMARMERELAKLQEAITSIQDTYGREHLQLTVVKAYVAKLLGKVRVVRYLTQHRTSFLQEFEAIAEATSTLVREGA